MYRLMRRMSDSPNGPVKCRLVVRDVAYRAAVAKRVAMLVWKLSPGEAVARRTTAHPQGLVVSPRTDSGYRFRGRGCTTRAMLMRLVIVAVVALAAVACAPGGISRDRAIELAVAAGGDSTVPPSVISVETGPLGRFADQGTLPDEPRDREVWAILLAGDFAGECVVNANGESICPPGASRKLVVLDFATGEFIFSESP
jgi:hypothetical protein